MKNSLAPRIITFILLCTLLFLSAAAFFQNEEAPVLEEQPVIVEGSEGSMTDVSEEVLTEEVPLIETAVETQGEEQVNTWLNIQTKQVEILKKIYDLMTPGGQAASQWFLEGNYEPCSWKGLSCDMNGMIISLDLRDAAFFCAFPKEILELRELEELHLVNTLLRGPLPQELLWLPRLRVLELKGNLLSGPLPQISFDLGYASALQSLIISDNLENEEKNQKYQDYAYADLAFCPALMDSDPQLDLVPGMDGEIPASLSAAWLGTLDLSGNTLWGLVPNDFMALPLSQINLSNNNEQLSISQELYDSLTTREGMMADLSGVQLIAPPATETVPVIPTDIPVIPTDVPVIPTEIPVIPTDIPVIPTEIPVIPTEIPVIPTDIPVIPTDIPVVPTDVPVIPVIPTTVPVIPTNTVQPIIIVVTATSVLVIPNWYTSTPVPGMQPVHPQPLQPVPFIPQPVYYASPTPMSYQPPVWIYPTATTIWQPVPQVNQPTVLPTSDPAAFFNFTYVPDQITAQSIPMTWSYTGMKEYMINYLDAGKQLYPGFALEWTSSADLCSAASCSADVRNIPNELLQGGNFSIQLQAKDNTGRVYQSSPVEMSVIGVEPTETPQPEETSLIGGFLRWFFGPLLRLFGAA